MHLAIVLVLASAGAPVETGEAAPVAPRLAVGRVTAEVLRAETSTPETGAGGLHRQVRQRTDNRPAVEFE